MAMAANDIERLIRARIPDADVTIRDLAGDGDHYAATVIAESFRGKSRVQQHQIVYEALKAEHTELMSTLTDNDKELLYRQVKIDQLTFELATLKRLKFAAKSEK